MKNCPACAEEIQDSAIKCRFCGTDLLTISNSNAKAKSVNRWQKVWTSLLTLTGVTGFAVFAYAKWVNGNQDEATTFAYFGAAFLLIGPLAAGIGNAIRKAIMPSAVFASGAVELAGQRMFWAMGPQAVAVFLAFAGMIALSGELESGAKLQDVAVEKTSVVSSEAEMPPTATTESVTPPTVSPAPLAAAADLVLATPNTSASDDLIVAQQVPTQPANTIDATPEPVSVVEVAVADSAYNASFDCARATSKVEKLICSTRESAEADKIMSAAYASVRDSTSDKVGLRAEQQRWLTQERNQCVDVTCLITVINTRVAMLTARR